MFNGLNGLLGPGEYGGRVIRECQDIQRVAGKVAFQMFMQVYRGVSPVECQVSCRNPGFHVEPGLSSRNAGLSHVECRVSRGTQVT